MPKPVVASYCSTFLKPEMLHIYRQITGLREFRTFVIARTLQCEERFPFEDIEIQPRVRSNFIRRFWLKHIRKEPPIVYRGEFSVLIRLMKRRQADMMHVYFGHTAAHLLPFIKHWDRPTVASFHGMDVQTREHQPGYADQLRELLQVLPLVMARSESLRERLVELGCPEEKIRVNRTGIPMNSFAFREREAPADGAWKLVQACRLIKKKGLDDALKAFAQFAGRYPKATFTIAGEGPLEKNLKKQARELGLGDKVTFAGFLPEEALCRLYHSSHIFLHPSRMTADQNQEGVPNSMLEAMATGLPVVATQHGGIPEAVVNGRSGLLVAERDVDAIAAGLLRLAADAALWQIMGRRASEDVRKNFEQAAQIAKLEGFYREALERG